MCAFTFAANFQVPPAGLKIPGSSFFLQDKKNQKRSLSGLSGWLTPLGSVLTAKCGVVGFSSYGPIVIRKK